MFLILWKKKSKIGLKKWKDPYIYFCPGADGTKGGEPDSKIKYIFNPWESRARVSGAFRISTNVCGE